MKLHQIVMAAVVLMVAGTACSKSSDNNNNNNANDTDRNFVVQASYSNRNEIAAGTMAASKGMRDSIRIFGQMMVNDHTTAQNSLDSVATSLSITTPQTPDSLHLALAQQMMSLTGRAFDTTYIHRQVIDHQNTINLFQDEIKNGNNTQVKAFANKNLPVIQMHYNMATSISQSE